ncbi:MAG: PaaI family thioesterase [Henriciella sp.]|nr:PaaI family thioesterase [Henriciella sp.]
MPDSHLLTSTFPQPAESSKSLGFELISLDMSKLETRVRFDGKSAFTNPAGYVQGGYLSAMLDDTIGMLATVKMGTERFPSTIDLHTTFLRPVRVGAIDVTARLRNIGRQVIFAEADLYDSRGKEAARATASLAINPMKAPAT